MKNSNDTIGNQTHNLPACSAVPQSTAPPRAPKEETVLQGITHRLAEVGRCYGIDLNVLKTKLIGMSRQPFPVKIMIHQKQLENVEYFNYMGSLIKQVNVSHIREIKFWIGSAKVAKNTHQQSGLKFKEETNETL